MKTDKRIATMRISAAALTEAVEEYAELRQACTVAPSIGPERAALATRVEKCILRMVRHAHAITCPSVRSLVRVHGDVAADRMLDEAIHGAHESAGEVIEIHPGWISKGGDA